MRTKYGTKIVMVVAYNFSDFFDFIAKKKDIIPAPFGSQGVAYSKTHNYRYVQDSRTLHGHRGVEVIFTERSDLRSDINELKLEAEKASEK